MNIYFSCSITGGRKDEQVYQSLVDCLLADRHEVPTAHLSRADVLDLEAVTPADEVYRRDSDWVKACDALVAEVSTPSHGVGYEIALALALGKPVLCLYRSGCKVSKMITGNDSPGLKVAAYDSTVQAVGLARSFLAELTAPPL
jgi:2'-deoxynucleoside 5'-phosphate N-hydrolase